MGVEFVTVKTSNETLKMNLILNKLEHAGIKSILIHDNMSTLLPLNLGKSQIQVPKQYQEKALKIISEFERNESTHIDQDFRDATLEDIHFEESVQLHNEKLKKANKLPIYIIIFGIIVFLMVFLLNSQI